LVCATKQPEVGEGRMKSFRAVYKNDSLKWLDEKPEIAEGEQVIVMVKNREVKDKKQIREILDRAWGSWGTGKTLDEIDEEIRQMRERDWD